MQRALHLARDLDQVLFLRKRHDCNLHRRHVRVQPQNNARLVVDHVFVVRVEQQRDEDPFHAHRRLDHPRQVALVGLRIQISQVLLRLFLMHRQVEVGPVGDSFQLAPAERELVLDVGRLLRVMR